MERNGIDLVLMMFGSETSQSQENPTREYSHRCGMTLPKKLTDRVIPSGTSVAGTRGRDRRGAHLRRTSRWLELTGAGPRATRWPKLIDAGPKGSTGCSEFDDQGETEKKMRKQKTC